ncbi:hypothetical protein PRIPAC_97710 [Pristionchus pacificus]|uniref:G protein-coupled receptor n=1 Tax=Pristionchus pacificus TaxID=54126 RepID=A0A2A6D2H9_PRIPA|nr:hypothetical protein PRIPAC_97710 [Pristionchus pacificus]|eukprot:PDM84546.1 G protein-coupled receptor [Pristionchus pacificus]
MCFSGERICHESLRNTPKSFASFGLVMKFQVIVDILTNLAATAVMNRTIIAGNSYVYIAHGPCTLLSSSVCFYSYGIMVMGASMTIYIVLVSFIVRLQIMRNRQPSNRLIILHILVITVPVPSTVKALFIVSRSEDSVMRNILQNRLPNYVNREATIFGIEDVRNATMSISLSLMIIAIIPIYFVILLLRSKIIRCLQDMGEFISGKTKKMNAQFEKMLTLQCIVPPVVFVLTMLPIQLEYLELIRHPIIEAIINIFARLSTLLSPLIVLFHIVPYRKFDRTSKPKLKYLFRALAGWIKGKERSLCASAQANAITNADIAIFLKNFSDDKL